MIDFEMGKASTRRMLLDLGATDEELRAVAYFSPDGPPNKDDISTVSDRADLAVIDASLGAFHASGLDDNKRQDVERFAGTWIDPLWKGGVATLTLDHVTKSTEGRGKYAIGSERKVGHVDTHLGLETVGTPLVRGGTGLVKVRVHKDRLGFLHRPYAAEIAFTSDPETHAIAWEIRASSPIGQPSDSWRPTVLMERVLEYLSRQPKPVSRNNIVTGISGNRKFTLQAITALIEDGLIEDTGSGLTTSGSGTSSGTDGTGGSLVPPPKGWNQNQSTAQLEGVGA